MKKFLFLISFILTGCSSVSTVSNNYNCDYSFKKTSSGGKFYKNDGPLDVPYDIKDISEPIPKTEKLIKAANKPYRVMEQGFVPMTKVEHIKQEGYGSWYGSKYHGQKTSSGEVYDMFKMTAASPILPILSYAKVTNLNNGRSVIVKVNDRGPFLNERIIDLSFIAACKLGYAEKGVERLRVETIVP